MMHDVIRSNVASELECSRTSWNVRAPGLGFQYIKAVSTGFQNEPAASLRVSDGGPGTLWALENY